MNILRRIYNLYLKRFYTERWARNMGVFVGSHTRIYPGVCFPTEPYLISIGEHVQVTSGVSFYTHGGSNSIRKKYPEFDCFGKIRVEDWVYLGAHSLIMPGVTIGEGALVAAGSVVTKSVQPHTVVAGNPAKYVCDIETYIQKNMHFNVNTKGLTYDKKKEFLLSLSEDKFIKK